jgi:hypothetical protein
MPTNIVPIILLAVLFLWVGGAMAVQIRYRLRSTRGINSLADFQGRIQKNSYTLVQFFVPL